MTWNFCVCLRGLAGGALTHIIRVYSVNMTNSCWHDSWKSITFFFAFFFSFTQFFSFHICVHSSIHWVLFVCVWMFLRFFYKMFQFVCVCVLPANIGAFFHRAKIALFCFNGYLPGLFVCANNAHKINIQRRVELFSFGWNKHTTVPWMRSGHIICNMRKYANVLCCMQSGALLLCIRIGDDCERAA